MLKLKVILSEKFNEETNRIVVETIDIELEHSLASLSKWEEKWKIPLLSTQDKTEKMNIDYLMCMCLTPDVTPEILYKLTEEQQTQISDYLETKHTATWFSNQPQARSGETITAELIYFWMSSFNINWESQYWNLSRLLTLIQVFSVKQDNKPTPQSRRNRQMDIARINAQRRAELGSKG